jgi:glycosyltransferase involved in cell wall biosynthesis
MSGRPLTLAIEGLGATEGPTDGAGRYLTGLLTALGQRTDVRTVAYVGPSMRESAGRIAGLDRVMVLPAKSRLSRIAFQHLVLPALPWLHAADVVVYPNNYVPVFSLRPALAIVQNMFLAYPNRAAGRARAVYRRSMRSLIAARSRAVIAVSLTMAKELERTTSLTAGSVHVIYPALDVDFFRSNARTRPDSTPPYFLAVGTVWRHRNFDLAIRGLAGSPLPHRLVIAGAAPSDEVSRLRDLAQGLGVGNRLQFLGVVPPDQMPGWYGGAAALVATSELESFGMSIVEAMAAGTPIVAVRRTVYEETVGDAGLMVDPNPEALAAAMVEVTRLATRHRLIGNGYRRVELFTFSRYADQLIAVCRACAEHPTPDRHPSPAA